MTPEDVTRAVARIDAGIVPIKEALNAADRVLGDGDTGMTVAAVVAAWRAATDALPPDIGEALVLLGRETGRASGSSLGAVLATGLSAAGRSVRGKDALSAEEIAPMLAAAAQKIIERSGAAAGGKTILDALLRIEQDARAARSYRLRDAVDSARAALDEFRDRPANVGRARMYGDRAKGCDDPGMLAAYLLLAAASEESPRTA